MKCPHCGEGFALQTDAIVRPGLPGVIAVTAPLAFTVADTQRPDWPALRDAMLANVAESYRLLIDEALTQEGHRP